MRFQERLAHFALRIGVAFAFLYPPIAAYFDPYSWVGYLPAFVRALPIDQFVLLHLFGAVEVVIAAWILIGHRIRVPAILAVLILLAIVILDFPDIDVLFRDLSIAAMSFALAVWPVVRTE